MASKFISDNLLEDLLKIDILGSKGSRFALPRCHLLLEINNRWLSEDDLLLEIQTYRPDGFGIDLFMLDVMEIPKEEIICETDQLLWNVNLALPPRGTQLWMLNLLEENMIRGKWDLAYRFDSKSSWMNAPQPSLQQTPLRCLELFAGAYGGWKGALEVLNIFQVRSQTVGIEIDERASKAYALSHFANWLGPNVEITDDWLCRNQENWIWQQDVLSERILKPLTFLGTSCGHHIITMSGLVISWTRERSSEAWSKALVSDSSGLQMDQTDVYSIGASQQFSPS